MSEADATRPRAPFGSGAAPQSVPQSVAVRSVAQLFQPAAAPDEIGRIGDYRVLKLLGEGGMGSVYLAEDTKLNRQVALKFLLPAVAAHELGKVRFLREARAAAGIRHENVIVIYQVDEIQGVPFIAMERLKGVTLEDWIRKKGTPPVAQSVRVVREMLAGLQAAHEVGLIHRDIKPANVWLEAPKGKVRLLDFGLAVRADGDERVTNTGVVMGTPAYMSPEQAHGRTVDLRSDLFSVGVVLYRLCTGKMPFTGGSQIEVLMSVCSDTPPPPREVNPDVPGWLDALVLRMLAKDPAGRPATAAEAIKTLSGPTGAGAGGPALDVPLAMSGGHALTPTTNPSRLTTPAAPRSTNTPAVPPPEPVEPPPKTLPRATVAVFVDETESDAPAPRRDRKRERARERQRERDEERDENARRLRSDLCGAGATLLGLAALGALFLIVFNKHALALPLAIGGLACGFFGRGQTRVNAIVLNAIALVAAGGVMTFAPKIRETFDITPPGGTKAAPAADAKPGAPAAAAPAQPGALEVEFDDENRQAGFRGFSLFVSGRAYPIDEKGTTALTVAAGTHTVEVRYDDGTVAHSAPAVVRSRDQGKAVVRIPKLDSPDALGAIEIRYQPMPAAYWEGVELLVDEKPVKTGPPGTAATHTLPLRRGNHTLRYVRGAVVLYTATVAVRPSAGPTVQAINLVERLVVPVTMTTTTPPPPGFDMYIEVDGKFVKNWPADARTITFDAFAGERVVRIKTRKPIDTTLLMVTLTLQPGQPYTFGGMGGPFGPGGSFP